MLIPILPELEFSEIPKPSQHKYVGDRFSFMRAGDPSSPALVLLHGVGANSMYWRYQYAGLCDRFHVIGWNAPGVLLSDELVAEWPNMVAYADSLRDFFESLNIGSAILVGNSFGSRIAQGFVAYHRERVDKLVLTGTGIGRRNVSAKERERARAVRTIQFGSGGFSYGSGPLSSLLGSAAAPETHALVRSILRATNRRGFLQAALLAYGDFCSLDHTEAFTMPVLMIQGVQDSVNNAEENAALLAKAIPSARLEMLQDCGHLPEIEMPEIINKLIKEFVGLRSLDAGTK